MTVADPGALAGHPQLKAPGQHATLLHDGLPELSDRQRWCRLCSVNGRRLNRCVAGHHCWVDDCVETAIRAEIVQHRRRYHQLARLFR